jgi:hypothetical protein
MLEPAGTIADYNPISLIVDGVRETVIGGLTVGAVAAALGAIALIGGISMGLSALALRRRLRLGG